MGPALLVCFTVVLGSFNQNSRMNDLNKRIGDLNRRFDDMKAAFDKGFDDLKGAFDKRFDDLRASIDHRFDDMKDYIRSEFKRVDERIDRLEPAGSQVGSAGYSCDNQGTNPVQVANNILSQWGPALLVCFTVVLGLFYQNSRMNDLNKRIDDLKASSDKRFDDMKAAFDKRFDDLKAAFDKRFDDLKTSIDHRFDDMKDYIMSEFKRVDERIDRLESSLVRK
jgi:DNA anti-recombination protein RmuC